MRKKTLKVKAIEGLEVALVFKEDNNGENKEIKMILPDIVKKRWQFKSEKEEVAFAGFAAAIGNEFIYFGLSEEEVSQKFKALLKRTVKAGLLKRKDEI